MLIIFLKKKGICHVKNDSGKLGDKWRESKVRVSVGVNNWASEWRLSSCNNRILWCKMMIPIAVAVGAVHKSFATLHFLRGTMIMELKRCTSNYDSLLQQLRVRLMKQTFFFRLNKKKKKRKGRLQQKKNRTKGWTSQQPQNNHNVATKKTLKTAGNEPNEWFDPLNWLLELAGLKRQSWSWFAITIPIAMAEEEKPQQINKPWTAAVTITVLR